MCGFDGGCVIWLLRVVLCRKIGDLLGSFHCTRVKEKGLTVRTRGITLLNVIGKLYTGILVDGVRKVTEN